MNTRNLNSGAFELMHPNAAGIDIASQMHYIAVPMDRAEQSVRKFGSFTEDLHEMARWLKSCNIDTVAMESTGVYWVQPFLVLEEYGFDVFLVNARYIKNVSGRKSDVKDCQWIQQLHSYGLLNKSFQPEELIRELRTYVRQRKNLTQNSATQIQLIQKAFDQMNIKLHNVISDITGKSGRLIIDAILRGERDAGILAEFADIRINNIKKIMLLGNAATNFGFDITKGKDKLYYVSPFVYSTNYSPFIKFIDDNKYFKTFLFSTT